MKESPWSVKAQGSSLPAAGSVAPRMPVRSRAQEREERKPAFLPSRVRHPDLAPICTLRQADLEPPSAEVYDREYGHVLVLEFDPGLPMLVIHKDLTYVYVGRREWRAFYRLRSEA